MVRPGVVEAQTLTPREAHEVAVDDLLAEVPATRTPVTAAVGVATETPVVRLPGTSTATGRHDDRPDPAPRPYIPTPRRRHMRAARRLQARKVSRLVRRVDLWSLLKLSALFHLCLLLVNLAASVILWWGLHRVGAVSSVEDFIQEVFLLQSFRFEGRDLFRLAVLGGLVGVLLATLATVVAGAVLNLLCDLTGGLRVSVVQEETTRPVPARAVAGRRR